MLLPLAVVAPSSGSPGCCPSICKNFEGLDTILCSEIYFVYCVPAAASLHDITCHTDWNDVCGLQDLVELLHGSLHLPFSYPVHFCLEWRQLLLRGLCTQIRRDSGSFHKAHEKEAIIVYGCWEMFLRLNSPSCSCLRQVL